MEKLTLNNIEHAFYQSGKASGELSAMDQISKELRSTIRKYGLEGDVLKAVNILIEQIEAEAAQRRQWYTKFINEALKLRKAALPLHMRVRRAMKAFMAELEG